MYSVNYSRLVEWLVPPGIRKSTLTALAKVLVVPVVYIYNHFTAYRTAALFRQKHTGQVCHLVYVLNTTLDAELSRITIADTGSDATIVLLRPDEAAEPVLLNPDFSDNGVLINTNSGYDTEDVDFVVNVPASFSSRQENDCRQLVNSYKLVSKRFTINKV